tara:strand:+ start:661 stop:1062 length:402 start_codon:yes stop_codon:yes gene_type:complete
MKRKKTDFKIVSQEGDKKDWKLQERIWETFTIADVVEERKDYKISLHKLKVKKEEHDKIAEAMVIRLKTVPELYKMFESLDEEQQRIMALFSYHTAMSSKRADDIKITKEQIKDNEEYMKFLDESVVCQDNEK